MAISLVSESYPPLTTTFTPPAGCSDYSFQCHSTGTRVFGCFAYAYPDRICSTDNHGDPIWVSCYPESGGPGRVIGSLPISVWTDEALTYTSASVCPVGMTTAFTAGGQDQSVVCCPSGFAFVTTLRRPWCLMTVTSGVFTAHRSDCADTTGTTVITLGPSQTDPVYFGNPIINFNTLTVNALPIQLRRGSGSIQTSEAAGGTSSNTTISKTAEIAIGVVIPLLTILVLFIAFLLIKRHRKKKQHNVPTRDNNDSSVNWYKPELDVSGPRPTDTERVEHDPTAVRAELVGSPEEEQGAGVHVVKPELEGTLGEPGMAGPVYVKKKSELEAKARSSM
ncbi:hypothetical protein GGS20DRAFT_584818 [Poronia punctata]|nr:hypothetical protein GGS20DRAFT_584818 [Poronia punctata]